MIKINLVPLKEKKKQQEFIIIFFASVISAVLALGMFWVYIQRVQVKGDLNAQIKRVDDESKGYQEKINEVKDLQAKEANLETLKKNIKNIQEVQRKVVVAIDQLALNLPEGIWLTSIVEGTEKDSNKFTIAGYAYSISNLKSYLSSLQKIGSLFKETSMDVKNITASVGVNKQMIQFEIITRVADPNS